MAHHSGADAPIHIAVDPALILADLEGFKAYFMEETGKGSQFQVTATMPTSSIDGTMNSLEEVGLFKPVADGGFGLVPRNVFFPKSEAVLANHLKRFGVALYLSSHGALGGYAHFPSGVLSAVVGGDGGGSPGFPTWDDMKNYFTWARSNGVKHTVPLNDEWDNHVYRVTMGDDQKLILKTYKSSEDAGREFNHLQVLHQAGINNLPLPVSKAGCVAVFSDVGGKGVKGERKADIKRLADFLIDLDKRGETLRGKDLPSAPDARLHLDSYLSAVNTLWNKVFSAAQKGAQDIMFFMMTDLEQLRQDNINHFFLWCKRANWDKHQELPEKERIFSPADFGLHNCLRSPAGELVFLDFVQSGWDDPAHLLADFFFNTERDLSMKSKLLVLDAFTKSRAWDEGFINRFWAVADLVAVEWILKTLSVVLPEERERIERGCPGIDYKALVAEHLATAHQMRENFQTMEHICKHDQLLKEGEEIR